MEANEILRCTASTAIVLFIASGCAQNKATTVTIERHYAAQPVELTADDFAHGRQQVQNMLSDRPPMSEHIDEQDEAWQWAVQQFAGQAIGVRFNWSSEYPPNGLEAVSRARPIPEIRVHATNQRNGESKQFQELWAQAVFELLNLTQHSKFTLAIFQARANDMPLDDFLVRMAEIELDTARQQQEVFHAVWLPHFKKRGLTPNHRMWRDYDIPTARDYVDKNRERDHARAWFGYWTAYWKNNIKTKPKPSRTRTWQYKYTKPQSDDKANQQ